MAYTVTNGVGYLRLEDGKNQQNIPKSHIGNIGGGKSDKVYILINADNRADYSVDSFHIASIKGTTNQELVDQLLGWLNDGTGGGSTPPGSTGNLADKYDSVALENDKVVKASAGVFYSVIATSTLAGTQYIQVHNSSGVPLNNAIPIYTVPVSEGETIVISAEDFDRGYSMSSGIYICNSTTIEKKTLGADDCWFNVEYK
jgi:hypothetical protein